MGGIVIAGGVFLFVAGAIIAGALLFLRLPGLFQRRRLEQRILDVSSPFDEPVSGESLIKRQTSGPLPALDRLAGRTGRGSAMGTWIEQSGMRITLSGLLLIAIGAAALTAFMAAVVVPVPFAAAGGAALGFAVPFLLVQRRRTGRLRKFEEMFPEALDLISRAVRAGHAFSAGLKMAADEVAEPVGPEFRKTFEEQNYGLPLKDALINMSVRVPLLDVKFFSTAVLIQRDTGGNLAEILDNLAHVVRERFKILRQVRVHTAHGRFTGYVLLALPAALAVALMFINPEHMSLLFRERVGQMLVTAVLVMQTVGYLWIRKIIKIEV
jgi:tight adherence protein B